MLGNRSREILTAAINCLEDGSDPFNDSFLAENKVTLNECYALADHLALGAKMLLATSTKMKGRWYDQDLAGLMLAQMFQEEIPK